MSLTFLNVLDMGFYYSIGLVLLSNKLYHFYFFKNTEIQVYCFKNTRMHCRVFFPVIINKRVKCKLMQFFQNFCWATSFYPLKFSTFSCGTMNLVQICLDLQSAFKVCIFVLFDAIAWHAGQNERRHYCFPRTPFLIYLSWLENYKII